MAEHPQIFCSNWEEKETKTKKKLFLINWTKRLKKRKQKQYNAFLKKSIKEGRRKGNENDRKKLTVFGRKNKKKLFFICFSFFHPVDRKLVKLLIQCLRVLKRTLIKLFRRLFFLFVFNKSCFLEQKNKIK